MSDNLYQAPEASLNAAAHLGPILVSCRDRSEKERLQAMNQSILGYALMPVVVPILLAGFLFLGLEKLGIKLSVQVAQLLIGTLYVTFGGWFFWQLFHKPGKPSLVLHELGFRFKKTVVKFDDLASIRFGRKFSTVNSALLTTNRALGKINRRNAAAAELLERAHEGSMTLVFKNGTEKPLNGMQIHPRPEDLNRFLDRLKMLCPDLLEGADAPRPTAPGVDDLSFKRTSL